MLIKVGEKEFEATFNAFTPIAYSRCFNEVVEGGRKRPKDIADAVSKIAGSLMTSDVPAIVPLLEIFYACIKTATPKHCRGQLFSKRRERCSGSRGSRKGQRRHFQVTCKTRATRDTSTTASNAA